MYGHFLTVHVFQEHRIHNGFGKVFHQHQRFNTLEDAKRKVASFDNMPRFFTVQGRRYSTDDGTLVMTGEQFDEGLYDSLGKFCQATQTYQPQGLSITIKTFVKVYLDVPYDHYVFGQVKLTFANAMYYMYTNCIPYAWK